MFVYVYTYTAPSKGGMSVRYPERVSLCFLQAKGHLHHAILLLLLFPCPLPFDGQVEAVFIRQHQCIDLDGWMDGWMDGWID